MCTLFQPEHFQVTALIIAK